MVSCNIYLLHLSMSQTQFNIPPPYMADADKAFFYMVASAIRKLVAKCVLEAQVFSALQNVSLMKAVAMVLN